MHFNFFCNLTINVKLNLIQKITQENRGINILETKKKTDQKKFLLPLYPTHYTKFLKRLQHKSIRDEDKLCKNQTNGLKAKPPVPVDFS